MTRDEEIRVAALKAAVAKSSPGWSVRDVLEQAELYASYIRTGQAPPEQRW